MFHGNVSLEIARALKVLRRRIEAAQIPSSNLDETLNIATWNNRRTMSCMISASRFLRYS